jgi:hypothetical protein
MKLRGKAAILATLHPCSIGRELRGHFPAAASSAARAQADRSAPFDAATRVFFSAGVKSTLMNSVLRSAFGFGGLPIFMHLLWANKISASSEFYS